MKQIKKIIVFLMTFLCMGGIVASAATTELENLPYDSYTYWQEDSGRYLAGNRIMFELDSVISADSLAIEALKEPSDITLDADGKLYILDSANTRIVIVSPDGTVLSEITNFSEQTFAGAKGILVAPNGDIYIADTENMRVLVGDALGNLKSEILCPDLEIIPDDFEFRPIQLTIDNNGYLYVLSNGSFYGALVFAPEGTVEGFFGANTVKASLGSVIESLWNRWFMTDEQRSNQIQKIPYQFSDLCADENGLLYTTTGSISVSGSQSGQIRCLGPTGNNTMKYRSGRDVVNSDSYNFADEGQAKLPVGYRTQDFVSIDIQNDYIYALDQTYGRVFVYNNSCELLTTFGGGVRKGTQKGTFENATSLAVNDDKLYVLDSARANITVFKLNDYGQMVQQAASLTDSGKYIAAKPLWEKTIKLDRNNQLAYRGLARAALAEKDYHAAMKYSKQGVDRGIYDQSFEYVRNDFLENNIYWIIVGFVLIIAIAVAFVIMKKRGKIPAVNAPKLKLALSTPIHPFNNFSEIKYSNKGSVIIAAVLLVLYYIAVVLYDLYRGFAFSDFNVDDYNSLLTLLGSVGVVVLWIVCNWLVSVLAEGKGSIKEIFIVTCYSLLPLVISNFFCLVASNMLLLKEGTILTVVSTCCILLTGIMLCIGSMKIHEFDFFKFLWTTVITIIAMALVIFLCFMIVILLQQFFAFIKTIFIEVTYR